MPAHPSSVMEPLWCQFEALLPPVADSHPLGCHRPRVADRIVFDKPVARPVLESFDQLIGLDLEHLSVDGYCVKAPCGGDDTGRNPTNRGTSGQMRSVLSEGHGLPIGAVLAGANRHDSPLLEPTLECLSRFGFNLPDRIRVDLDSGYDSRPTRELLTILGCAWKISPKGTYIKINHTRPPGQRHHRAASTAQGSVDAIPIVYPPCHAVSVAMTA